ncbi:MAG TPA: amino acid permease [Verrucomicrobiota bacterium]|nr:amino acid permease [Verrucomicrobiota bacterium]HQL77558.1 amino acid permease [Verrucomicrobiota bacterium]
MDISTIGRPRNVGWVRAGALLYGDWGTSKAYVIGLAVAVVGFAALPHLLAVCLVTGIVGINYIWVCRCFATGGGVYTAAGLHSRRLAVVGGLLLLADFIVTASLSCLDAFHYLGFDQVAAKKWAITAIFLIGAVNFFGPKHTGSMAIWLAMPVLAVVIVLICAGLPHLGQFQARMPTGGLLPNWVAFVGMILALSGVEAAASSTGVMKLDPGATADKPSVRITSRRAVTAVMLEVVIATAALSLLTMCLPVGEDQLQAHREDMLRFMGETFVGPWFGKVVGWVFALLLLSAVNTAIGGMVALLYVMAHDRELPNTFVQLNRFGVPWVALMAATILPVIVLDLNDSVEALSSLYAIGVVGAIVLDIGSCGFARALPLTTRQRLVMKLTVLLLAAIWITIALSKPRALVFVVVVLAVGFAVRQFAQRHFLPPEAPAPVPAPAATPAPGQFIGQLVLVAARGWTPALQFALEESRVRGARLLVLYIREVAVNIDMGGKWQEDPQARVLFNRLESEARGLQVNKLYSVSDSPADTIIDIAATFGVDTVVLGGSRRAALVNLLKGNVVARVAASLPESMHLIVIG